MTPEIYFLANGGHIKIGYSQDVRRRSRALAGALRGRWKVLGTIPGSRDIESALHKSLAHHRVSGEWFHDNDEVRAAVLELIERFGRSGERALDRTPKNWPPRTIDDGPYVLEARSIVTRLINKCKADGLSTEEAIHKIGRETGVGGGVIWKFRYRSPLQVTAAEMDALRAADALAGQDLGTE